MKKLNDNELLKISCPIKEVYERFKHLDVLFSDLEWVKGDDEEGWQIRSSLYEMWQAIKNANT